MPGKPKSTESASGGTDRMVMVMVMAAARCHVLWVSYKIRGSHDKGGLSLRPAFLKNSLSIG